MKTQLKKFGDIVIGIVILFLAAIGYYHETRAAPAVATARMRQVPIVQVMPIAEKNCAQTVEALGTASANEAILITARSQKKVAKVYFSGGELVDGGTPLVDLESDEEVSALKHAEITVTEEAREMERYRKLHEQKAIPQKDYDARQSAYERAVMAVAMAKARLKDHYILAPFAGVLGQRLVSVGDLVSPGTAITTLDDLQQIKVDFSVPEKYLASLRDNLLFTVTSIAYPGRKFTGKISAITPRLNATTRNVEVRGIINNLQENDRWLLYSGMLLTINLPLAEYPAALAPETALLNIGERHYLFIYHPESQMVEQREVTLGQRHAQEVEITGGAQTGEIIVADGIVKLVDKMKIEVAPN